LVIVGHEHDRGLEEGPQFEEKLVHVCTQAGVEGAERFVEEEDRGTRRQGSSQGDALLLSSRQSRRSAASESGKLHEVEILLGLAPGLAPRCAGHEGSKGDVVEHAHVGEEARALREHGDTALLGGTCQHAGAVDPDVAGVGCIKAGYQSQDGRLPGAGRPKDCDGSTGGHMELEASKNGCGRTFVGAGHVGQV